MISINLRGSFFVGRMAIGLMEGTVEVPARLIMTASDMAYYRRETFSPYVASKHGVLGALLGEGICTAGWNAMPAAWWSCPRIGVSTTGRNMSSLWISTT